MNVLTKSTRLAATGAVTALAAATLVGATTTAANAEPVVENQQYTCSAFGSEFPVFLTTNAPGIEAFPSIGAGTDLPGGLLSVTNTFTIPDAVYQALSGFGVTDVSVPTFTGSFGDTPIGVDGVSVTVAGFTNNGNGTWSSDSTDQDADPVEGTGVNSAFEVPAAGEYDILSPATLDLLATNADGGTVATVPCTLAEGTPGAYHHIVVTKNESTVSGTAVKKTLKTTKVAKMKVTASSAQTPTGMVVVKEGKKTLGSGTLNDLGKATIAMGKLSKGEHNVKVIYKGDGYNKGSKSSTTFTVVKG